MALSTSEQNVVLPDISDRPHHPPVSFVYPKLGNLVRRIQSRDLFNRHG